AGPVAGVNPGAIVIRPPLAAAAAATDPAHALVQRKFARCRCEFGRRHAGMQGEAQSAAPAARLIASAFIRAPSSFPLQALKLACSSVPFPTCPARAALAPNRAARPEPADGLAGPFPGSRAPRFEPKGVLAQLISVMGG